MATKHVVVFFDVQDGTMKASPDHIKLEGGKDKLEVLNDTGVEIEWEVPEGAFTQRGPLKKKFKQDTTSPTALKQAKAKQYESTITPVPSQLRAKRRTTTGDPVIIIDL